MSRPVLHNPDPELRVKSLDVSKERIGTPEMALLIQELRETMTTENGIGIAAPQIGVHDRVILAEIDGKTDAYINPVITERSFRMIDSEEGCLSVPGTWGYVKRHRSVSVSALNENGESISLKVQGLESTIFQHEIDHLDGILFIDRADEITRAPRL